MSIHLSKAARIFCGGILALALFASGYVAGQNKFGQPKSVLHIALIKWNPNVSDAEKQKVFDGVKDMAAKIPGIKNVWLKGDRIQPRDFNAAFAIEFKDREAADAYAESPIHKAWSDSYLQLRAASLSEQVTNP
ncbi:MAG: Dabb family protein [Candidatus Acidiferrales bacterium]